MKKVSVVLPCYNDGLSIKLSTERIINILSVLKYSYEIILIDDASSDNSRREIQKMSRRYPKIIHAYYHDINVGRGGTVKEGILKAHGEIVGFLDIDLEVSENYLPAFIRSIDIGFDVATGIRVYKIYFSSLLRFIGSLGYSMLVRALLGLPFKDTEAGYKFFNRGKILKVLKKVKDEKWFFDTEILARSYMNNLKISEIPILFQRRPEKKSTVKLFSDSWEYFVRLLEFKNEMIKK